MSNRRMPDLIRVDNEDLKKVRVGTYAGSDKEYNGKPFTGFAVLGYYENDEVVCETQYVNGEQEGWVLEFYDNGQLQRETLNYGATTVFFREFDTEGKKIAGGFVAPEFLLTEVCEHIGEDPKNVTIE